MSKRMTVVFHDEDLYTNLKVEAARQHKPASNMIADAVREWLKGARLGAEVKQELESVASRQKREAGSKRVQT